MRGNDFRRVVLGMPGTIEASHMAHPDFRAHGRIFATLNAEETRGVVMLTPEGICGSSVSGMFYTA
jgi:hypothetical protein